MSDDAVLEAERPRQLAAPDNEIGDPHVVARQFVGARRIRDDVVRRPP